MKRPICILCLLILAILLIFVLFRGISYKDYSDIEDRDIQIEGTVSDISFGESYGQKTMTVTLKEGVLCYMKKPAPVPKIGSTVVISGKGYVFEPATVPGQFDKREYYNILGIHFGITHSIIVEESSSYSVIGDSLFKIRCSMSDKISEALPEREASILKTMLLGEKSSLDRDLKELYQRNGIAHILAISGLHISLLGMSLFRLLKKLGIHVKVSATIASLFVLSYGLLTGFSVSSVRAIFMFGLSMMAVLVMRSYDLLTALSIIACVILISQPLYVLHSGFVFSFGCILTISLLIPSLVPETKSSSGVLLRFRNTLLSSLTILVGTYPIYLWFYYQVPIYSVLLNFLVIPVMSLLVPLGIILIILMYIFVPGGKAVGTVIVGILKLFEIMAEFFDTLPFHYYTPGKPAVWQIVVYLMIMGIIALLHRKKRYRFKWGIAVFGVIFLTLRFNPGFELSFLDVGQGDCIFMRCEGSPVQVPGLTEEFTMLVDGGSSTVKEVGKYRILPFLKNRGVMSIDAIVLTHPDKDHTCGIEELLSFCNVEGIRVKSVIMADLDEDIRSSEFCALTELVESYNVPVHYISEGDFINNSELETDCLWPPVDYGRDANETSVVLLSGYRDFSFLLTGDVEGSAEKQLVENLPNGISLSVLKVAHHGSRSSTSEEFLKKVRPGIAVISAGRDNSYGHPHRETLEKLEAVGAEIRRTDHEGTITFTIN